MLSNFFFLIVVKEFSHAIGHAQYNVIPYKIQFLLVFLLRIIEKKKKAFFHEKVMVTLLP